jgi:hypothetical protein
MSIHKTLLEEHEDFRDSIDNALRTLYWKNRHKAGVDFADEHRNVHTVVCFDNVGFNFFGLVNNIETKEMALVSNVMLTEEDFNPVYLHPTKLIETKDLLNFVRIIEEKFPTT